MFHKWSYRLASAVASARLGPTKGGPIKTDCVLRFGVPTTLFQS